MTNHDAWLLNYLQMPPEQRFRCYAFINKILELGGHVAWVLKPSMCKSRGKKLKLGIGDFLLIEDSGFFVDIKRECEDLGLRLTKLESIAKVLSAQLRPAVLAFYHDFGIYGESLVNLTAALRHLGFSRFAFLTSSTVQEKLHGVDVLFLPDGDSSVVAQGLEQGGAEAIRSFVAGGGCCIAMRDSGSLVASPTSTDRVVGPQKEEFQSPASLLRMIPCDVLNEFSEFPAPSSVYNLYENEEKVRIYPFDGEVIVRVTKPFHPIMFGYSGKLKVFAKGPIFSTAIGSDNLCVFEKSTCRTDHHVPEDLAWRIAYSRPAIISGSYQTGKVVIVGVYLECPNMPSTWPILGNIVFNSISAKPLCEVERSPTQDNILRLADMVVHQSLALGRAVSSLELDMEVLTPRLLAVLDQAAINAWISSSKAVPEMLKAIERLARSSLDSAQLYSKVMNIRTSIEALESSNEMWRMPDYALNLLNRADAELHSALSTASRALKVLRGLAEQIGRSLTEVASLAELEATIKPDIATMRTLRCSAMTVVSGLLGGAPFHSPWYDNESGPCLNTWLVKGQEGLVAPILGLSAALERANMLLGSSIAISMR